MAIDVFNRSQFEAALPRHRETGAALCRSMGFIKGEYEYAMQVRPGVDILIRSSIREGGYSAEVGADSIRVWLVDGENHAPLGKKLQAWITRSPGWAERLQDTLRKLYSRGLKLPNCPTCKTPFGQFVVKKDGKNKGREFNKCWRCGKFEWTDQPAAQEPPQRSTIPAATTEEVVAGISGLPTVKAKVTRLKELIGENERIRVWALLKVYENQTSYEQEAQATVELNGVGFSGIDAEILSSFAQQYQARQSLSDKQMAIARKRVPAYAAQIERQLRA